MAALDALPGRGGTWRIGGRDVTLTNLDKVLAPGVGGFGGIGRSPGPGRRGRRGRRGAHGRRARGDRRRRPAGDEARPRPLHDHDRPGDAPPPRRPGAQPCPLPQRHRRRVLLAEGRGEGHARLGDPLAGTRPPDRHPHAYVVADGIATLAGSPTRRPWSSTRTCGRGAGGAPLGPRRHRSGPAHELGRDPRPRPALPARVRAPQRLGVPKVTGKRGIQVFIPIRHGYSFDETRAWVKAPVSRAVGGAVPDLVSWEWAKDRRDGRARFDFTQNWRNRTLVGP